MHARTVWDVLLAGCLIMGGVGFLTLFTPQNTGLTWWRRLCYITACVRPAMLGHWVASAPSRRPVAVHDYDIRRWHYRRLAKKHEAFELVTASRGQRARRGVT